VGEGIKILVLHLEMEEGIKIVSPSLYGRGLGGGL